ncbi:MAG: hypothetical protein ACLFV3_09420 [Phycisphaeraceae bacterium]
MSSFNTPGYDVPRTTGQCLSLGRALEPGETIFAALVEVPPEELDQPGKPAADAGLRRVDVSEEAWQEGFRPERLFSYWKTSVPEPNQKKKTFVDDAVLMNLLRRLEDATQPQRLAFRYVLALILMRKKLLRYDGSVERQAEGDGETVAQHWWQFTPKLDVTKGPMSKWHPDETIEVLDPELGEADIAAVTQQLGEILEAEL